MDKCLVNSQTSNFLLKSHCLNNKHVIYMIMHLCVHAWVNTFFSSSCFAKNKRYGTILAFSFTWKHAIKSRAQHNFCITSVKHVARCVLKNTNGKVSATDETALCYPYTNLMKYQANNWVCHHIYAWLTEDTNKCVFGSRSQMSTLVYRGRVWVKWQ